jgi:hypothetical protein
VLDLAKVKASLAEEIFSKAAQDAADFYEAVLRFYGFLKPNNSFDDIYYVL